MKKKLVILSGAGISAESGIQTFRDSNGLWENYKIEEVATPEAWIQNPELVLTFYNKRRSQVLNAHPNLAHSIIFELEKYFDVTVITQNIDDLHERAGSTNVLHLHGEILKKRCSVDAKNIALAEQEMLHSKTTSGGHWRPHIVWFGEDVPLLSQAVEITEEADIFLVIGTSLMVYPAANLTAYTPSNCEKWIIDPKIPEHLPPSFHSIQQTATLGMKTFFDLIRKSH